MDMKHEQQSVEPTELCEFITHTRTWLEKAVIGLNLCPFAKAVHHKNQIRYTVSRATNSAALEKDLIAELQLLQQTDPKKVDTTLLIHPYALTNFLDYNDFLETADNCIRHLQFTGQIQIASFHPDYQFANTSSEDIENFTNRSPYPMLHLLRESSIERAVSAFPDAATIYETNIETMRTLGHKGWAAIADNDSFK